MTILTDYSKLLRLKKLNVHCDSLIIFILLI